MLVSRRMYNTALTKKQLFPTKLQPMLRLWQLRVVRLQESSRSPPSPPPLSPNHRFGLEWQVYQVDLIVLDGEKFCRTVKEVGS